MAEDQNDKTEEEKLEFTPEGEALGYIGLDQAQVRAMQAAAESPGNHGTAYSGVPMAFEVAEAQETDDYYVIILSVRPQGDFAGRTGREQFFIAKEGVIAHRQVLSLPRMRRRFPLVPVALLLVALGVTAAIGTVIAVGSGGGNEGVTDIVVPQTSNSAIITPTSVPDNPRLVAEPTQQPTLPADSQAEPSNAGGPVLDPQIADAGLEYTPSDDSSNGLEIFATRSVAQSFTVPSDGIVTGVEISVGRHDNCPSNPDLDFRLLSPGRVSRAAHFLRGGPSRPNRSNWRR